MSISNSAFQILLMLRENYFKDDGKRGFEYILTTLERLLEDGKRPQTKDWLLEQAIESGRTEFKLIGKVNDGGLALMEWCDDAWNFNGMCSSIQSLTEHKDGIYLKSTYTLEELPKVIDNALEWFNSRKADMPFSNDKLHILAVK